VALAAGAQAILVTFLVSVYYQRDRFSAFLRITTGLVAAKSSMPKAIKFDHPFLFTILHKGSGTILFFGIVIDPRG